MNRKPVTLYGFGFADRSGRVRWLFEELGVPYVDHFLNWDAREHRSAEFLKINPMGRVPAVVMEGRAMIDAGAVCLTFSDLYPDKGMAPPPGSALRGEYYQWISFTTSTLEPLMEKIWRAKEIKDAALEASLHEELKAAALVLESGISGRQYLVGNEFTAADIVVGSLMNWGDSLLRLSPAFSTYFERLKMRPACKRSRIFD